MHSNEGAITCFNAWSETPFALNTQTERSFSASGRSIHSPRELYSDPPNINMEIGWHLSLGSPAPQGFFLMGTTPC